MTAPSLDQSAPLAPGMRINLAAALFDRLVAVDSALRDVVSSGFAKSSYSILVAMQSREFASLGELFKVPLLAVPIHRIDCANAQDGRFWIGDDLIGPDAGGMAWGAGGRLTKRASDAAMQVLERHGHRLQGHLARGGAVLVAKVDSLAEQQAICSMLLHYASDGVLTHQVRANATRSLPAFLAQSH